MTGARQELENRAGKEAIEALSPDDVRALIHQGLAVASSGEMEPTQGLTYSNQSGSETLIVIGSIRVGKVFSRNRRVRDLTRFQVNSGTQPPVSISAGVTSEFGHEPWETWLPTTLDKGREIIAGLRQPQPKPTPDR